jgi:hypothetical protein
MLTVAIACSACCRAKPPINPGGKLPPAIIQHEVRLHYRVFQGCYEEGLGRNPKLQGRVTVRFIIELDGRVQRVDPAESDMPDRKVVDCIVAEYKKLKFPNPEGGIVTVVYPIMFSPGDD